MSPLRHPALYQINTRVWLTDLSRGLGRPATLDDIPDAELDRVAGWASTGSGSSASGGPGRPASGCRAPTPSGGESSRRRCRT
jgi:hypothetical protein